MVGVGDKLICREIIGKCGINLRKVGDLKTLLIVSDAFLYMFEMAQKIIIIRCFDDLFETFCVGCVGGASFLVFLYYIGDIFGYYHKYLFFDRISSSCENT